jgi:predicted GNAT family acetyltransferase
MNDMEIQFRLNDDQQGSFFINQDGRQIAELDFEIKDNVLNAYHTGVRPELEGQGIAGRLFDEMVKYAREKGYKVIPTCSYPLAKFRRHPEEFSDIWLRTEDEPTGEACGIKPKR